MARTSRRRLLRAGGVLAGGVLAGCVRERLEPTSQEREPPREGDVDSLTAWERSTDCERRRDNVIAVARVRRSLDDAFDPIRFERLTGDEKTLLRTVTETGGHGTCGVETSAAFDRFLDRVRTHTERQRGDRNRLYLERGGVYYGLEVEVLDQVYAH